MSASENCIFCRIIQGEIPSARVYENEDLIVIRDIQPHAKVHLLVIPRVHLPSLSEAFPEGGPPMSEMLGRMFEAGVRVAREQGLLPRGFRSVINTGVEAGQTVHHIHLHVIGGEPLRGGMA